MADDPFEEQEIINLVYQVTTDNPFVLRDTEYANRRDLLYQRRFVSIPGITVDAYGEQRTSSLQFRSPEIEDDAHAFKNRMLAAGLKINVASVKKSPQAKAAAQKQEDFFYRHYYRWRDRGVFDPVLFDQASVGVGWTHLALNTDLLPILPDYSQDGGDEATEQFFELASDELKQFTDGEKPDLFVLEPIDAQTMYWSPDKGIRIQKALVPLNPLVLLYGQRGKQIDIDEKDNVSVTTLAPGQNVMTYRTNWSKMVTLYTVEDDDFCYHLMFNKAPQYNELRQQGAVLGIYKNIFKTPGFFYCPGERTSSHDPLYEFRPMLNGKYQTVPVKNVLTTAMTTAGAEAGQQRYTLKPLPNHDNTDDTNLTVSVTDDGVIVPPDGYEVVNSGLSVGPDLPAALETMMKLDTYGYPKALGNPQEISASSGYDRARIQDAVASLLDPPLGHFGTMFSDGIFPAMRNAVIEMGLPITIRSVQTKATGGRAVTIQSESTLKPDEASEDADIDVSFNSVSIFSRIAMQEEGLKMMQADMMDETEFITEVRGVDDLEAFRDQRALDKILKLSDDLAVADAEAAIKAFAAAVQQKAVEQNNIPVPQPAGVMAPTNGQQLRSDRGPSMPSGPGGGQPLVPTPPQQAELGAPEPQMPAVMQ